MKGVAVFQKINGKVIFVQDTPTSEVSVSGQVPSLKNKKHGFHIHEYGDITSCKTCGGHWNPFNKPHGGRNDPNSHAGDLGNITNKRFYFKTNKITLFGDNSIIGRTVVVHENEDDLGFGGHDDSLTTGHAGKRLDCAVIGIKKKL